MDFPIIRRRIRDLKDGVKNLGRTGSSKRFRNPSCSIKPLPSEYGIGTLGDAAFHFVDLLVDLKQKYWQVLPVGPTSFGDSPYQSLSAFAGNPYLIDLDQLAREKLLTPEEIRSHYWGTQKSAIDYAALFENRTLVLQKHLVGLTNTNRNFSSL